MIIPKDQGCEWIFSHIGYEIGVYCYKKVNKLKLAKLDWVRVNSYYLIICIIFLFQLILLVCVFVFGDDHVTCHVGADVTSGDNADPYRRSGGLRWEIFPYISFSYIL